MPRGAQQWKGDDDHSYLATFYNTNCKDKVRLHIQTRVYNGTAYCYYHYLVYDTVVSYDNRQGSYCGITLRMDGYCTKVMTVYSILDFIFHTYIIGAILTNHNGMLKYAINDFSGKDDYLRSIESFACGIIQQVCGNSNVLPLTDFAKTDGNIWAANLCEVTESDMLQALQQHSTIVVSPYYPTTAERVIRQRCNEEIRSLQEQHASELTTLNEALSSLRQQQSAAISRATADTQKELKEAKARVSQQQQELANVCSERDRLRKRVKDYERNAKRYDGAPRTLCDWLLSARLWRVLLPFINIILLLIIVVCLLPQRQNSTATTSIDSNLEAQNATLDRVNDMVYDIQQQLQRMQDNIPRSLSPASGTTINPASVKIDIAGYSGQGPLDKTKQYTVRAKGMPANSGVQGTWRITGAQQLGSSEPNTVTIQPNADIVTIEFVVNNQVVKSRTISQ